MPCVEHLAEEALQVDRLGRVETDLAHLGPHAPLDVGEQSGLLTGGREDRPEQVRGRRLPVGPGDRRDGQPCGRVAEELDRRPRHRRTNTRHDQLRSLELEPALHDERCRSPLEGLGREVVAVRPRARDAEEQGVARHLPRVVCQLADLEGTVSDDVGRSERCDEPLQLHFAAQV